MSEYISFNKSGQWELHKSDNQPHKVFGGQAKDGNLHEDHGTKGSLRGTLSSKKKGINWENAGKPAHNMASVANERHPGVGD
jgi:hypothetical protein